MAIPGFPSERCQRRNLAAALRALETAPVRLYGSAESLFARETPAGTLIDSFGDLPGSEPATRDAALARIRALQPPSAKPLEEGDLYLHFAEAANNSYIADRYAFMGASTLENIARGGAQGVAFMNSHRTGGFSSESELPFGRTYCGRYEQYLLHEGGQVFDRALVGVYLLRGSKPTGESGPTTDELHRLIEGGVLSDVSVGIYPGAEGYRRCDICGNDYYGGDCSHYAGSRRNVSPEQQQSQKERGVPQGFATYTLEGWTLAEVSGVYDGAVPGAGFAKGYAALQAGLLPESDAAEWRDAFAALLQSLTLR